MTETINKADFRSLSFDEVSAIYGGDITVTQCTAASALVGGVAGGLIGGFTSVGFGAYAGFMGGALIGGVVGGVACSFFFS